MGWRTPRGRDLGGRFKRVTRRQRLRATRQYSSPRAAFTSAGKPKGQWQIFLCDARVENGWEGAGRREETGRFVPVETLPSIPEADCIRRAHGDSRHRCLLLGRKRCASDCLSLLSRESCASFLTTRRGYVCGRVNRSACPKEYVGEEPMRVCLRTFAYAVDAVITILRAGFCRFASVFVGQRCVRGDSCRLHLVSFMSRDDTGRSWSDAPRVSIGDPRRGVRGPCVRPEVRNVPSTCEAERRKGACLLQVLSRAGVLPLASAVRGKTHARLRDGSGRRAAS